MKQIVSIYIDGNSRTLEITSHLTSMNITCEHVLLGKPIVDSLVLVPEGTEPPDLTNKIEFVPLEGEPASIAADIFTKYFAFQH